MTFNQTPASNIRCVVVGTQTKEEADEYEETLVEGLIGSTYNAEFDPADLGVAESYCYMYKPAVNAEWLLANVNLMGCTAWYMVEYVLDGSGKIETADVIWRNE